MYCRQDSNSSLFSLHDCRAEQISFENSTLSFYFPDGFWVMGEHPLNTAQKAIRTGPSKVEYHILDEEIDGWDVYIFSRTKGRHAVREDWEPGNFISAVNGGAFLVEFITEYRSYQSILHKCWVWFQRDTRHKECEIILHTDSAVYCWNDFQEDRYP